MHMTPPDIIILIIISFFTFNGFKNGFIKEALRIVGMTSGFLVAHNFYNKLIPYLEVYIINTSLLSIVSYLTIFLITLISVNILGIFLQKFFELILLGWLNRLLGTLLGLIKGVVIVSILIFILEIAPLEIRQKLQRDSELYKICNKVKNDVIKLSSVTNEIQLFQNDLNQNLNEESINKILDFN